MAITEPISVPTTPGFRSFSITARPVVSGSESPFTYAQQIQKHQGQRWEFIAQLPPMTRAQAEDWTSFFLRCNGIQNRFLMGDPVGGTMRGAGSGDSPLVKGASQTGNSLITDAWTISTTNIVRAGDWFSSGSGTSTKLYKVINDANSDGSGDATLDIWPSINTALADNAALDFSNAKGLFRLSTNELNWSINEAKHFGISFSGVGAL